jgi:hypothetical protein
MGAHATEQKRQRAKGTAKFSKFWGHQFKVRNICSKEEIYCS